MNEFAPAFARSKPAFGSTALPAGGLLRLRGAVYWPLSLLEAFTLQMSAHGHSVSVSMMLGDRVYALEQLAHAHTLSDDRLHDLTMALFAHFERQWPAPDGAH
ncbi:MAG: hypothetical protein EBS99_06600 [Betaproteobacteria bacterium]|nr:hypothetical protein [Betaproteobacteria bacterium]